MILEAKGTKFTKCVIAGVFHAALLMMKELRRCSIFIWKRGYSGHECRASSSYE